MTWAKIEGSLARLEELVKKLKYDVTQQQTAQAAEVSAVEQAERTTAAREVARLKAYHERDLAALEKAHAKELAALEKAARVAPEPKGPRSPRLVTLTETARRTGKLSLHDRIRVVLYRVGRRMSREEIAYYGAMSHTSGPVMKAFAWLQQQGSISYGDGLYHYVKWGPGEPNPIPDLKSRTDLFANFCARETGLTSRMAQALVGEFRKDPEAEIDRDRLCDLADCSHTSGPMMKAFRRLQTLDMIEVDKDTKLINLTAWFYKAAAEVQISLVDHSTGKQVKVTRGGTPV